jgi:hypothetical protein
MKIDDGENRYSPIVRAKIQDRVNEYLALGGDDSSIHAFTLDAPKYQFIDALAEFVIRENESVILDISSMPKRFFFPVIREFLDHERFPMKDLLVTYTRPVARYAGPLAEDYGTWAQLPGFVGIDDPQMMVISVGFEELGIKDRVRVFVPGEPVRFLLPFPAPISAIHRSWALMSKLVRGRKDFEYEIHRANSIDVSAAFDRLQSLTRNGQKPCQLAPFGPKPISVAMCIHASLYNSAVYYTQPSVYHPDYAQGISLIGDVPETYAYCLKLDGRCLYTGS